MKNRNLLVITDTKGQFNNGNWYIFNAVANELHFLSGSFDSITLILSDYSRDKLDISLNLIDKKIKVIALPKIGGNSLILKIKTVFILQIYNFHIIRNLFINDYVHLRGPNSVTLISLFILPFFQFKSIWFKYATNWNNTQSSINYKFQKWFLSKVLVRIKVTINGFWINLPKHIIPFENPCLTELQIIEGNQIVKTKQFGAPYQVVFVGRIDSAKGIDIIIEFIQKIDNSDIEFFHVIGEGELKDEFEKVLNATKIPNNFYGNLPQTELFEILKIAHCIFLPSKSEGFPKVLAEAMNFGCIPIASTVGSITHYIKDSESGIILNEITHKCLQDSWNYFLDLKSKEKQGISQSGNKVSLKFTFENYLNNLKISIFNDY